MNGFEKLFFVPDILVVTVSAGTPDLAAAQVLSMSRQVGLSARLVLVQNGGSERERALVRSLKEGRPWVETLELETGDGKFLSHGEALDAAFSTVSVREPRVLVLDSDCFLTEPSSLAKICREVDERGATGARSSIYGVETFHVSLLAAKSWLFLAAVQAAGGFAAAHHEVVEHFGKTKIYWDTGVKVALAMSAVDRPPTLAKHVHVWYGTRHKIAPSSDFDQALAAAKLAGVLAEHGLDSSFEKLSSSSVC